jgi:hypothetical protein
MREYSMFRAEKVTIVAIQFHSYHPRGRIVIGKWSGMSRPSPNEVHMPKLSIKENEARKAQVMRLLEKKPNISIVQVWTSGKIRIRDRGP